MFALMKKLLSSLVGSCPVIEPIEYCDGLLAFRCDRSLPFEALTVTSLTKGGSIATEIRVCSYDVDHRIYRAQLADCSQTLARMQMPSRGTRRLNQTVRVSSRQIPKFFALTEDVSVGGLRLSTAGPLTVGSQLDMSLDLDDPNIATIRVIGEVRWSAMKGDGSYHSGVRFEGIDTTQHRILERYIESRLATQRTVHGAEG